jgi:hypothetical protein
MARGVARQATGDASPGAEKRPMPHWRWPRQAVAEGGGPSAPAPRWEEAPRWTRLGSAARREGAKKAVVATPLVGRGGRSALLVRRGGWAARG